MSVLLFKDSGAIINDYRPAVIESSDLPLPKIESWERAELPLPFDVTKFQDHSEEVFLTIAITTRSVTNWAKPSHEIAWWQQKISGGIEKTSSQLAPTSRVTVENTRTTLMVTGSDWILSFDKVRGYLVSWTHNGESLVEVDPKTRTAIFPNFWRAPTDNDRPGDIDIPGSLPYWKHYGVDCLTSQLRQFSWEKSEGDGIEIKAHTFLSPPILGWGYNVHSLYTVSNTGKLTVNIKVQPTGPSPVNIPRLGINLRLPKRLSKTKWFGLGPGESYPDKRGAQRIGIWSSTVENLATAYDVPQENGNRMETRWLKLSDDYDAGIKATLSSASQKFSWTASRHGAEALEHAKHPCDLVAEDATLLNLSAKVAGVGSAACGPGVREDLQVKVQDDEFEFVLEATQF